MFMYEDFHFYCFGVYLIINLSEISGRGFALQHVNSFLLQTFFYEKIILQLILSYWPKERLLQSSI